MYTDVIGVIKLCSLCKLPLHYTHNANFHYLSYFSQISTHLN